MTTNRRRWVVLALLCTASFMMILDASIVTVAVPSIERSLDMSTGSVEWVMTAYIVAFGGFLLCGGRIADLVGARRVFVLGVGLFGATSLLCGLSVSGGMLIAARTIQGTAAAGMTPAAFSLVLTTFPAGSARNRAIGIWSAVAGVGASMGSLIGGPLTDALGWEWIFFINVPIAAVLLALSPLLSGDRTRATARGVDAPGAIAITAALMLLIYGVSRAPAAGWTAPSVSGALLGFVVLLAAFIGIESRSAAPLVPLRLFRSRSVVGGNIVGLAAGMSAFGQGFMLTQYGQQVLGWSATRFGLASLALPALAVVGSMAGQHLVSRVGPRVIAAAGMALICSGFLWWTGLQVHGSYVTGMLPGLLVFGFGLGGGGVAGSIAAVSGVRPAESGVASGLNNAAFQIGGALGIAILSTIAAAGNGDLANPAARTHGVHVAFVGAAIIVAVAGVVAIVLLRIRSRAAAAPVCDVVEFAAN
jgi:EmrB/QacA subfamily drug resistance transporter